MGMFEGYVEIPYANTRQPWEISVWMKMTETEAQARMIAAKGKANG